MHDEAVHYPRRRARTVLSPEVSPAEAAIIEAAPPPADTVSAPLIDDAASPLVDPTRFSRRRRKTRHSWHYRATRITIALSLLSSVACVVFLVLSERAIAQPVAAAALFLAVLGALLTWQTFLAARVQGYAIAAAILATLAAAATLALPASWFTDDSPDAAVEPQ